MTATIPEVPVYLEKSQRPSLWDGQRQWVVYVQCPHCGDRHNHGGGPVSEPPDLGLRGSHCLYPEGDADYVLVPGPEGMEKPKALGKLALRKLQKEADLSFSKRGALHG